MKFNVCLYEFVTSSFLQKQSSAALQATCVTHRSSTSERPQVATSVTNLPTIRRVRAHPH